MSEQCETMSKPFKIAEAFHPGEYIADEIEARGWSRETLCKMSGLGPALVDELLAERRPVTSVVAYFLSKAFGTDAQTWVNLQKAFDDFHADRPAPPAAEPCDLCGKPLNNVSPGFGLFEIKGATKQCCIPCGEASGGKEIARAK